MRNTTIALPANVLRTEPAWLVSVLAGVTATSTKLMLALAHLLAAAIIIPTVTRRLSYAPGHHGRR
jgi:hypothetical protein